MLQKNLLLNEVPEISNISEFYSYQSHNMNIMINGTIDLMNHPNFDFSELGKVRSLLFQAQNLVRIANTLTTWRRELKENDLSSSILAYALERKFLTEEEIKEKNIDKICQDLLNSNFRKQLIIEWLIKYEKLMRIARTLPVYSINVSNVLENLPHVLISLHLNLIGHL